MHQRYGKQDPEYWNAFVREWDFIQKRQVDHAKGWYGGMTTTDPRRTSRTKATAGPKPTTRDAPC